MNLRTSSIVSQPGEAREHTGLQTPRTHSLVAHVVGGSAERMAAVWSYL